jgi:protein-S-isoprenylcysteine O-methyltransferase Ste14
MIFSFWLILLAVLLYGLIHSLLASLRFKNYLQQKYGPVINRWFRLAYNFIAVLTLLPILILPVILPDKNIYTIPFPWFILSVLCQLMAIVALIIGLGQTGAASFLGIHQLFHPEDVSAPHFVTEGLYRYVRHPLYTAGLVIIWLFPYLTLNLLGLDLGITIYLFVGAHFEEQKLLGEFGEAYADYRRRTPMLVPGLHLPHFHAHLE